METPYGDVRVKKSFYNGKLIRIKPEFEDCKKWAEGNQISIAEVEHAVHKTLFQ